MINPNSRLAVVMSWLPWSSPIIMPMRMGLTSVSPLGRRFDARRDPRVVGAVWLSARIYRVGMLMYGKKPSFAEVAKWIATRETLLQHAAERTGGIPARG